MDISNIYDYLKITSNKNNIYINMKKKEMDL